MCQMRLLPQIKCAIPDNPNNIDLTFSPKNRFLQFGKNRIFSISLKTHKTERKL